MGILEDHDTNERRRRNGMGSTTRFKQQNNKCKTQKYPEILSAKWAQIENYLLTHFLFLHKNHHQPRNFPIGYCLYT